MTTATEAGRPVVEHKHNRRQYATISQAIAGGEEVIGVIYFPPRDPDDSGFTCMALVDAPVLALGRNFPDDYLLPICVECLLGKQPELGYPFALAREDGGAARRGDRWELFRRWPL